MNSFDIHTTLLQADWRACLTAWTERARVAATPWPSALWRTVRRLRQPTQPDEAGVVLGPVTMRFDVVGISVRQGLLHVVHPWLSVREGTATSEHLFLWLDKAVIIVPIRSLPPGMPLADFQTCLDAMHDAAQRRPTPIASSVLQDRSEPVGEMATADS